MPKLTDARSFNPKPSESECAPHGSCPSIDAVFHKQASNTAAVRQQIDVPASRHTGTTAATQGDR